MYKLKFKSYVSLILSTVLTLQVSMPVAIAGEYMGKAKAYVNESNRVAENIAGSVFRQILMNAVMQSLSSNINDATPVYMSLKQLSDEIQRDLTQVNRIGGRLEHFSTESIYENVSKYSQKYFKLVSKIESIELQLNDYSISAQAIEQFAIQAARTFEGQLAGYCKEGVAIDVQKPLIPNFPTLEIPFSFMAFFPIQGDASEAIANSGFSIGGGSEEQQAYEALALNGSVILGEYLMTGNLVLSGGGSAAAAGGGASISMAGAMVGLGIFAAVAVVAYLIMDSEARAKARDLQRANQHIFNNSANAETVRQKFKGICNSVLPQFSNFSVQLAELLRAPAEQRSAEWKSIEAETAVIQNNLREKSQAVNAYTRTKIEEMKVEAESKGEPFVNPFQKKSDLEMSLIDQQRKLRKLKKNVGSEEKIVEINDAIVETKIQIEDLEKIINKTQESIDQSEEQKAMNAYADKLTFDDMAKLLKVAFLRTAEQASVMSAHINAEINNLRGEYNLNAVRSNALEYARLAQVLKLRSQSEAYRNAVDARSAANKAIEKAYSSLDQILAKYTNVLLTAPESIKPVIAELKLWYESTIDISEKYPNDHVLSHLVNTYYFLQGK